MPRRSSIAEPTAAATPVLIIPAGLPEWITPNLVEQTLRVWNPYYDSSLTVDDALGILLNVGRWTVITRHHPRQESGKSAVNEPQGQVLFREASRRRLSERAAPDL